MKLIEPNVKELVQEPGLDGIYKQIAYGGHLCYKSERVGNEKEFVESLISREHRSPLEHGTVYLTIKGDDPIVSFFKTNPYSHIQTVLPDEEIHYITTNYRVIIENQLEHCLKYLCEPTEHHEKRRSFHIICSRGIMDEFVRHK